MLPLASRPQTAPDSAPDLSPSLDSTDISTPTTYVAAPTDILYPTAAPTLPPIIPTSAPAVQGVSSSTLSCAGKTKCGQMDSCEEARYYLTMCGATRLDGDHDGTPCESICGQ